MDRQNRMTVAIESTRFPYLHHSTEQDLDEYAASISRYGAEIKQLSKGRFVASSSVIRLLDFTLALRKSSARSCFQCWVPQEATFLFPLDTRDLYVRGQLMGANRQVGSLGNHEVHAIYPESFERLVLTIPLDALPRYLNGDQCHLFLDTLANIEQCQVDAQSKALTTSRLLQLFRAIQHAANPLTDAEMALYCQSIIDIVYDYLAYQKGMGAVRPSNSEKILQRAMVLINANPTQLFTLDEMAKEIYASKRAIQYAFSSITNLSPMRLQKKHRLNLMRKEILSAKTPSRFSDIVARYSFSNPGRLSREYLDLFGERPSDTMKRLRPTPSASH